MHDLRRAPWFSILGVLFLAGCSPSVGSTAAASSDLASVSSVAAPAVVTEAASSTVSPTTETERVTLPLAWCRAGSVPTLVRDRLTVGAVGPFDDELWDGAPPAPGGLNGDLAVEIAAVLGYPVSAVSFVEVDGSDASLNRVDVAFGRWHLPNRPSPTVDHTAGYLDLAPVLVTRPGDTLVGASGLDDLDGVEIAVVRSQPVEGSTPDRRWFGTAEAALDAVRSGQVRAAVVDQLAATGASPLVAVARVPADEGWQSPQLAGRLAAGSSLTACLSAAIDLLRVEGALDEVVAARITLPLLS